MFIHDPGAISKRDEHRIWWHMMLAPSLCIADYTHVKIGDGALSAQSTDRIGLRIHCGRLLRNTRSGSFIPRGSTGTIIFEDDAGVVAVRWDDDSITMHLPHQFWNSVKRIGDSESMYDFLMSQPNPPRA